jgi:hypothetical protein
MSCTAIRNIISLSRSNFYFIFLCPLCVLEERMKYLLQRVEYSYQKVSVFHLIRDLHVSCKIIYPTKTL